MISFANLSDFISQVEIKMWDLIKLFKCIFIFIPFFHLHCWNVTSNGSWKLIIIIAIIFRLPPHSLTHSPACVFIFMKICDTNHREYIIQQIVLFKL